MPSGAGRGPAAPRREGDLGFVGVCFSTRTTAVVAGTRRLLSWRVSPLGEANIEALGAARGSGWRVRRLRARQRAQSRRTRRASSRQSGSSGPACAAYAHAHGRVDHFRTRLTRHARARERGKVQVEDRVCHEFQNATGSAARSHTPRVVAASRMRSPVNLARRARFVEGGAGPYKSLAWRLRPKPTRSGTHPFRQYSECPAFRG